jgi:hypothetical protein
MASSDRRQHPHGRLRRQRGSSDAGDLGRFPRPSGPRCMRATARRRPSNRDHQSFAAKLRNRQCHALVRPAACQHRHLPGRSRYSPEPIHLCPSRSRLIWRTSFSSEPTQSAAETVLPDRPEAEPGQHQRGGEEDTGLGPRPWRARCAGSAPRPPRTGKLRPRLREGMSQTFVK